MHDKAPKNQILFRLARTGISYQLIFSILPKNPITIENGPTELDSFQQVTEMAQGGKLKLQLFDVLLNDFPSTTIGKRGSVRANLLLRTDDLATYRTRCLKNVTDAGQKSHAVPQGRSTSEK